ncbi:formyltransferase family protein [Ekhidna sp.]|uniref:formyltransferase family protein n=1 Tax=Ekhidna sp. TaxID=2608089 RepID=UPI003CCBDBE3
MAELEKLIERVKIFMFFRKHRTIIFTDLGSFYTLYFPLIALNSNYKIQKIYISSSSRETFAELKSLSVLQWAKKLLILLKRRKISEFVSYSYICLCSHKFHEFRRSEFVSDRVDYVSSLGFLRKIPLEQIEVAKFTSNIHWSLLPKYAGMHPVYWTIRNSESEFGYTIHELEEELDRGYILFQKSFPIEDAFTANDVNSILRVESRKSFSSFLKNPQKFIDAAYPQNDKQFKAIMKKPSKKDFLITESDTKKEILLKFRSGTFDTKIIIEGVEKNVIGIGSLIIKNNPLSYIIELNGLEILVEE